MNMRKLIVIGVVVILIVSISSCKKDNTNTTISTTIPTNGLVAWYPFNGNANDSTGKGLSGTVYNATLTSDRFGKANSAYSFNGINSYIDLGIDTAINNVLNDFSLSYWIKTNIEGGCIISSYSNENGSYWRFLSAIRDTNDILTNFLINGGDGIWQDGTSLVNSIEINKWYNITVVRNGKVLSTYINDMLSKSDTVSSNPMNNPTNPYATTKIGVDVPSNNTEYFSGVIDNLLFYNRALSTTEIYDIYNAKE